MTTRPWLLVLLLVGIFVAGGVAGGFVTVHYLHNKMRERAIPEHWGPARLKALAERLDLSREQVERLRPVMRRYTDDLARLRQEGFSETRRILERLEEEVSAELTPEQRQKYEQMNREFRERARKMFEQRKERRDGDGGRPRGDGRKEREPPPVPPPGGVE